ncbi:MAG: tRNA (adenosine(37)-N6)-threonylcarbamoyltransferase complex transferase subunit TsaD [Pseudomonadota bacterium]
MLILGLESSCDETAAAIFDQQQNKILSQHVASQDKVHAPYGGVVPELASRQHLEKIIPIIRRTLKDANLQLTDIDGLAVTNAPGLMGSLLIGIQVAKGLALALNKPLIGVNHLEGHLNAINLQAPDVPYPHIGLVVSGGHTSLYDVENFGEYKLLGATRDDAAGEAYDKVAKLLGLGYPGGPIIDKLAPKGNPKAFRFTLPQFGGYAAKRETSTLDFSFSGIKTAALLAFRQAVQKNEVAEKFVADLAASFQNTVVNFLVKRALEAAHQTKAKAIVLAGGVAANSELRKTMAQACEQNNLTCLLPEIKHCTDNAAMIAYVGARYLQMGKQSDLSLNAIANQEIGV